MLTVHKATITAETISIDLPLHCTFLSLQLQRGDPQLWYKCDSDDRKVSHRVEIIGTGHELHNPGWRYAGTFLVEDDRLVFHVFIEERFE